MGKTGSNVINNKNYVKEIRKRNKVNCVANEVSEFYIKEMGTNW